MPPIRFGRKKIVRNALVPRMPRVSSSAMLKASTLISTVDTMVKTAVNQNAWVKVSSIQIIL